VIIDPALGREQL